MLRPRGRLPLPIAERPGCRATRPHRLRLKGHAAATQAKSPPKRRRALVVDLHERAMHATLLAARRNDGNSSPADTARRVLASRAACRARRARSERLRSTPRTTTARDCVRFAPCAWSTVSARRPSDGSNATSWTASCSAGCRYDYAPSGASFTSGPRHPEHLRERRSLSLSSRRALATIACPYAPHDQATA